jgi:hypothetical protein
MTGNRLARLRTSTRLVMIGNTAASAALAATDLVASTTVLTLAVSALAFDVAAFAVSQGVLIVAALTQRRRTR